MKETSAVSESTQTPSKKLSTVAVSATALYSISGLVNATPVEVSDSFSINTAGGNGHTVEWDVDGDGTIDFSFDVSSNLASFANIYGRGATVSATYASTSIQTNQFFNAQQVVSNNLDAAAIGPLGGVTATVSFASVDVITPATNTFFEGASGGLIGFQIFVEDGFGDSFFGWADISIAVDGLSNTSLTVNSWCYEDEVNKSIHVGTCAAEVPAPTTPSLLLLGLGAAGVVRWRAQKRLHAEA